MPKSPSLTERARRRKETKMAERARTKKTAIWLKRANTMQTPKIQERAEDFEPTNEGKRASESQPPRTTKRADIPQPPDTRKRAAVLKPSDVEKRAMIGKTPVPSEQARVPKTPVPAERASGSKPPDGKKRADNETPDALQRPARPRRPPPRRGSAIAAEPPPPHRHPEWRRDFRALLRGFYDLQVLRIQTGNRIVGDFKAKLGQRPGEKEATIAAQARRTLERLRTQYRRLARGVVDARPLLDLSGESLIGTEALEALVRLHLWAEADEAAMLPLIARQVEPVPIWKEWLRDIRGIGPVMAGVLICEIDIAKARYVSSLWKYAGVDVAPDGRGRGRFAEHLVDRPYTTRAGGEKTRKSITFNPFLKTKLLGPLAASFLQSNNERYRGVYDQAKRRYATDPARPDLSQGHLHRMAMRYMIKLFLADLYNAWRPLEGLPVEPTYHETKHGGHHGSEG